jgi:predicted secreted protein
MTKYSLLATILIMIISPLNTFGDDSQTKPTRLNISASESVEVEGDLLDVILRYETAMDTPEELQENINKKMQLVVQKAGEYKNIKFSTGDYSVYEYTQQAKSQEEQKTLWKGSQSIQIKPIEQKSKKEESREKERKEILELTKKLQSMGLALTSLNYVVSPELREKTRESLIEGAVKQIIRKSKEVAKVLKKENVEILNLDINSSDFYPSPMRSYSKLSTSIDTHSDPVALPSNERVSITVNAVVLISKVPEKE